MDASAIMQNDARVENIRAMTDFTREYGVYSSGLSSITAHAGSYRSPDMRSLAGMPAQQGTVKAGQCIPWEAKRQERPGIIGDEALARRVWEEIDAFGHTFIWHCLVSF